jgi:drug/metabolite transporter (DMT)-like permease
MSLLVWVMMGIAIWHFAIFFPDRFRGGIVGAFVIAIFGAVLVALAINGFNVPGRHDTHLVQAFIAIPGAAIALVGSYLWGDRVEPQRPPLD